MASCLSFLFVLLFYLFFNKAIRKEKPMWDSRNMRWWSSLFIPIWVYGWIYLILDWMHVPGKMQLAYGNAAINKGHVRNTNQQATGIWQVTLNSEERKKGKIIPPKGGRKGEKTLNSKLFFSVGGSSLLTFHSTKCKLVYLLTGLHVV